MVYCFRRNQTCLVNYKLSFAFVSVKCFNISELFDNGVLYQVFYISACDPGFLGMIVKQNVHLQDMVVNAY